MGLMLTHHGADECHPAPRQTQEWPPRALAVAETRLRGPTGRVGAGPEVRASPEMRPGSHDDWVATPQASHSHPVRRLCVTEGLLCVARFLTDYLQQRCGRRRFLLGAPGNLLNQPLPNRI